MRIFPFLSALVALGVCYVHAQSGTNSATTIPVGYMKLNIAAGTGTTHTISVLSVPLSEPADTAGQSTGRITGVTAATISNANAGWTPGQLSSESAPNIIRITSGSAAGRSFLISTATASANTATTLTIDATEAGQVDLTTLGIVTGTNGDTYEILPCDTIAGVFGTPATTNVVGSVDGTGCDIVQLLVGSTWRRYYYNTAAAQWRRLGIESPANTVVIRPDTGIIYSRIGATAMNLELLGRVPATKRVAIISNSGVTMLSNAWPVDTTLGASGIQDIPGWVKGDSSIADVVQVLVGTTWRRYYHNGSQWLRLGIDSPSNTVNLVAGGSVILTKKTPGVGVSILNQPLPYSL